MVDPYLQGAWATVRLLEFCRDLPSSILRATAPGTYGSVEDTLAHLVASDAFYACIVEGRPIPNQPPRYTGLEEMLATALELADRWANCLDPAPDPEQMVHREWQGSAVAFRIGTVLAQAVHHAGEHRSQVCTVLGSLGIDPPALDAWAYEDWLTERRDLPPRRRYRLDK